MDGDYSLLLQATSQKEQGKDLDIGSTIYDGSHKALSIAMWGVYIIVAPRHATIDIVIELFEEEK